MEHFWALRSLECFSNITQDIMGISGFMIILCPSVIEVISVNAQSQAANGLKYCVWAAASWNFLVQNPSGHCWEVLVGFCPKLQSAECTEYGRHFPNHT